MICSLTTKDLPMESGILYDCFEELSLPVAPVCNMTCNFCSKDCDCICSGNNPQNSSKAMTPKQAVERVLSLTGTDTNIKIISITGPGEPLCNFQTFEVLRRLNAVLPNYIYSIGTNGFLLDAKAEELSGMNVKRITVTINAFYTNTIIKLYSRIVKGNEVVIIKSPDTAKALAYHQEAGIEKCMERGISVKVRTVYFPGINYDDIFAIAHKCKAMGINSMVIAPCRPGGKYSRIPAPSITELECLRSSLLNVVKDVEIGSHVPYVIQN